MFNLTYDNYFSVEADKYYMSVSQYKNFQKCSAKAMNDLNFDINEHKESFIEGELFEALTIGDKDLFFAQHPELISSQGPTKGQLKTNYKKVLKAAEKFNEQEFFKEIINGSKKQVILTGVINGIKIKGKLDLLNLERKLIPDIKCMANFNDEWDKKEKCYKPWYYTYDYVLQLAVYQELVRQNFGVECNVCLLAATKEETPDISAPAFNNKLLNIELEEFSNNIIYYDKIKKGLEPVVRCECCDFCKQTKIINKFEEVN